MTQTARYPGTDRKFMATTTQEDFLMTEDDFEITVIDPYRRLPSVGQETATTPDAPGLHCP